MVMVKSISCSVLFW